MGEVFWGEFRRAYFDLAQTLGVCSWLARNGPAGQCGVSKRFGFSMMDGRETVPPSGGRCVLGASGWKPLLLYLDGRETVLPSAGRCCL